MNSSGSTTTRSNASKNVSRSAASRASTPVDTRLKTIRTRPIDPRSGVDQSIEAIEVEVAKIGAVEGLVSRRDDLHVLLRHRLLLQAEVGEGAVAVQVTGSSA